MKRLYFAFLITLLAFILTACGSQTDETTSNSEDTSSEANTTEKGEQSQEQNTNFPEKPIELVVPYSAGGVTDTYARILAESAQKHLPNDQPITVVNKPGGSAVVGLTEVLNSEPDGYKLGIAANGPLSITPSFGEAPFTSESFDYILGFTEAPFVLMVNSDSEFETFDQWLEYVKANPGEFVFASSAVGNMTDLSVYNMEKELEFKTEIVPFEGGGPAMTALLGGHVDGFIEQYASAAPRLEDGEVRVLANLSSRDIEGLDDVPKSTDLGIDVSSSSLNSIFSPKGIPDAELKILQNAFKSALEDPKTVEAFNNLRAELNFYEPEYVSNYYKERAELFNGLLKDAGIIE